MKAFLRSEKNHKDIVAFSFRVQAIQQLEWEDEHEFRYNDEMYDVVEKKAEGNQIIIRCIADKKETALLHEYQKQHKRNSSSTAVVQLITAQFLLPGNYSIKPSEKIIEKVLHYYSTILQSPASTVIAPPPDVC